MAKQTTVTYETKKSNVPYAKKNKYQVNNIPLTGALINNVTAAGYAGTAGATEGWLYLQKTIVGVAGTSGKRKCGKFTISLSLEGKKESLIYWSLVHVGEDREYANWLNPTDANNVYKPTSAVLASGMNDTNAGPVRIYCPLFKNLNQNDKIALTLAVKPVDSESMDDAEKVGVGSYVNGLVRYAICFN